MRQSEIAPDRSQVQFQNMLQDQIATMLSKFLVERQRETRDIWVHASSGPEQLQTKVTEAFVYRNWPIFAFIDLFVNRLGHFGASRQLTKRSGDCKE